MNAPWRAGDVSRGKDSKVEAGLTKHANDETLGKGRWGLDGHCCWMTRILRSGVSSDSVKTSETSTAV